MTPDAPELSTRWPGPRPRGRRMPGAAPDRRDAARSTRDARPCRAPWPPDACASSRVRHHRHRRRAGRPRGRRLRCIRGTAHRGGRARGARWPGRDVLAHRELSRLSQRRLGRRACEPRTPAGQATRGGDSGHALGRRHRSGDAPGSPRRRRCRPGADHHSGHRRHVASPGDRRLRPAHRQGHLLWRGTQRGSRHARARRPSHRRRKLGRPGRLVLRQSCAHGDARRARRVRWKAACPAT